MLALLHLGEFPVCGWLIHLYVLAMSLINSEQKVMAVKLSTGRVHLKIFAEDQVIGSLLPVLLIRKNYYMLTDYFGLCTFENVYQAYILKNYLT